MLTTAWLFLRLCAPARVTVTDGAAEDGRAAMSGDAAISYAGGYVWVVCVCGWVGGGGGGEGAVCGWAPRPLDDVLAAAAACLPIHLPASLLRCLTTPARPPPAPCSIVRGAGPQPDQRTRGAAALRSAARLPPLPGVLLGAYCRPCTAPVPPCTAPLEQRCGAGCVPQRNFALRAAAAPRPMCPRRHVSRPVPPCPVPQVRSDLDTLLLPLLELLYSAGQRTPNQARPPAVL